MDTLFRWSTAILVFIVMLLIGLVGMIFLAELVLLGVIPVGPEGRVILLSIFIPLSIASAFGASWWIFNSRTVPPADFCPPAHRPET